MDVDSKNALRQELDKMGYTLIKARREKRSIRKNRHRIKKSEIIAFAYEFAGMYGAGL
jgi:type II secretory pathway component PulF